MERNHPLLTVQSVIRSIRQMQIRQLHCSDLELIAHGSSLRL